MFRGLLARNLPSRIRTPLFGYREEDSIPFSEDDSDWRLWGSAYFDFYSNTQTNGLGGFITRLGYSSVKNHPLNGKTVLEIGPGSLPHRHLWRGQPSLFISVDIDPQFHSLAEEKCGCPFKAITRGRHDTGIPVADESVDVLFAFYSLEHVVDLQDHIKEMLRVLRPGGFLVGAVPNEGGLAWGLARYLGTRKWIRNKYNINYDKIIAWEHPNYVDFVQETLNKHFSKDLWRSHPLPFVKSFNLNLISSFVYSKSA